MLITERWTQRRARRNALVALRELQHRRDEEPVLGVEAQKALAVEEQRYIDLAVDLARGETASD